MMKDIFNLELNNLKSAIEIESAFKLVRELVNESSISLEMKTITIVTLTDVAHEMLDKEQMKGLFV